MITALLVDDGTLDTVFACSKCGVEYRYNFVCSADTEFEEDGTDAYDVFLEQCVEDFETEHECDKEDL